MEEADESVQQRSMSPRRVLVAAVAVVAVVGLGWVAMDSLDDAGPSHHEFVFPEDWIGVVWFTVDAPDAEPRTIDVEWGRLETSFVHESADPVTYFFDRGGYYGRLGPLLVDVDPGAEVSFSYGEAPQDGVDIGATPWDVIPVTVGTQPAEPAGSGRPLASASVDEWVSYGLEVEGVSIRSLPSFDGDKLGTVTHGEVYSARCWAEGDELTNGNNADPSDDNAQYTSSIWYEIEVDGTWGFIPDVWFARRADTDRLNLPECER